MKVARLFSIAVTVFRRTDVFIPRHLQEWRLPIVQGLKIDDFSKVKMLATQKELEEERDAVAKILK